MNLVETILIVVLCTLLGVILALFGFTLWRNSSKNTKKTKLKKKVPIEFSKKILMASYAIAIVVILYTMYINYLMIIAGYVGDPSSLNTLIMLTLGELGAANSFYFWKARTENIAKIQKEMGFSKAEEIKNIANNEEY